MWHSRKLLCIIFRQKERERDPNRKRDQAGLSTFPLTVYYSPGNTHTGHKERPRYTRDNIGGKAFTLKAFADNLILMVEQPEESIPKTIEKMMEFGKVSGFNLNKSKMKLMVKNMLDPEKKELQGKMGLLIVKKAKYLGIDITMKNINL